MNSGTYTVTVDNVEKLRTQSRDEAWCFYLALRSARIELDGRLLGARGPQVAEILSQIGGKQ